jgi:serine protease
MKRRPRPAPTLPRNSLRVEQLEARDMLNATLVPDVSKSGPAEDEYEIHLIPSDPSFPVQWALNNTGQSGGVVDADIDGAEAWDVFQGSLKTVVAVVDTGIDYRHKDLFRNIWINQAEIPADVKSRLVDTDGDGLFTFWDLNDTRNQGAGKISDLNANNRIDGGDLLKLVAQGGWANGISDDGDQYIDDLVGWNFVNNTNNPLDDNDHGTHTAGILGATGQDGQGIAGINFKVQMMAIKAIAANGQGGASWAVAGLRYAIDHGAILSNNSYGGGTDFNQELYNLLDSARAKGHIAVFSAGNGGSDLVGDNLDLYPTYPAAYDLRNVVTVAATTRNDARYAPSNYGPTTVDLGAPGRDVLSTVRNDGYKGFSGTSMAAPHVTGVLALVRGQNPSWTYYQAIDQVLATADKIPALKGRTVTGGRLNAFRALTQLRPDGDGPVVVSMVPGATGAQPVSSVRLTFSEGINPATFALEDVQSFTGQGGPLSVTGIAPVSNSDNRSFDLFFSPQSAPGTYRLEIGPDVRDLSGNRMDQDADGVTGEFFEDRFAGTFVIQPVYTFSNTTSLAIRDLSTAISKIVIDQDITAADLNVRIDVKHTFDNDLLVHLKGPDGTDVILVNRRGGAGDNFKTLFDDEATQTLWNGTAPFAGSFRPEAPLSAFDGKNARGTWQLIIEDRQRGDVGTLNNWSLIIENGSAPGGTMSVASASGPGSAFQVNFLDEALPAPGLEETPAVPAGPMSSDEAIPPPLGGETHRDTPTTSIRQNSVATGDRLPERLVDVVFTVQQQDRLTWSYAVQPDAPPSLEDLLMFFARSR